MAGFQGRGRGPQSGATLKDLRKSTSVLRLLRGMLREHKGALLTVVVCIVISAVTSLASSLFSRSLIDDYITPMLRTPATLFDGVGAGADYQPLALALLRLGVVILVGIIADYAYSLIMIRIGQGTMKRLRTDTFTRMQQLPLSYFDSHSHGDLMSVYTNDIDSLRQVIGSSLPRLLQALITLVATFVSMVVLSIPLTLVSLLFTVLIFLVTTRLGRRSKTYFTERQRNLGRVNGFIEEMVTGQKVVKVYCHEQKALDEFAVLNEDLRRSVFNANKIGNIIMPINSNIGNFGYVFIAIIGAVIALGGSQAWWLGGLNGSWLTLGTIVSFLTLHKHFTRPVSQISNEINQIVMAAAGADRVYAMLDETPEVDEGRVTLTDVRREGDRLVESAERTGRWAWKDGDRLVPLEGLVQLQDVDFGYVPGKQVLYDISLTAWPGQKIAFVGGTGAGKTTITNLINRFYEISDGTITYDGFNIRDISKASLRRSLGIVLQETHLFSGTVLDNIRFGRPDATDEQCREAARRVCADAFIRRLPNGYDTQLSADGGNLSQGERQLLAIARAAVADTPVLILDEATSSIDTRTEKMIQQGMDSLMKGRTNFIIAHRLSTVLGADYIMVLDHGRIIERGKHAELLAQKGKYYELFTGNQLT